MRNGRARAGMARGKGWCADGRGSARSRSRPVVVAGPPDPRLLDGIGGMGERNSRAALAGATLTRLAGAWRGAAGHPLLEPRPDQPDERAAARGRLDVRLRRGGRAAGEPDRRRRRRLHDDAEASRGRARRRHRRASLEVRFGHQAERGEPRCDLLGERRRPPGVHRPGPLRLRARRARPGSPWPASAAGGASTCAEDLGRPPAAAVDSPHHARRRLQGPPHRRRARERGTAGDSGRRPRLRRAHGRAALDLPHHSASGRARLRDLAARGLEVQRRRQQLGGHGPGRSARASSTCPRDRPPPTSTAPTAPATTCSRTRCSRWTPRPGSGSGISRPCTTTSGTATFLPPPSLVTVTRGGRRVDAVAQTSKQGYRLPVRSRDGDAALPDRRASRSRPASWRARSRPRRSRFRRSPPRSRASGSRKRCSRAARPRSG